MGYLNTQHIFGHNMSYFVTAYRNGTIGRVHIKLNTADINLQTQVTSSEVMWLKTISFGSSVQIHATLPAACSKPINEPTASPTFSPTGKPTPAPTPVSSAADTASCAMPPMMIILYVVLITVFLLLLFCWYARKNRFMNRMIRYGSGPVSSRNVYNRHGDEANDNLIDLRHGASGKNVVEKDGRSAKYRSYGTANNASNGYNGQGTSGGGGKRTGKNKAGLARKMSDRYVGEEDSDAEYSHQYNVQSEEKYRKMSKVSSIDIEQDNNEKAKLLK